MDIVRWLLRLPPGASTVADGVDGLHLVVISLTMLVSFYVFGAAAWFTVRYRRKKPDQPALGAAPARHEGVFAVLIGGTFLFFWVIGFRQYVAMADPPRDADIVYVEAKQWMWKFTYPDGRSTNDTLTVPVGRPIKLVMTSRDVIHSFFVPAFRTKRDVVPGRTVVTWFQAKETGSFPIWCAEYCGISHSMMRGEVVVLSQADYMRWLRSTTPNQDGHADCGKGPGSCGDDIDLVARGKEVAVRRACVACHTLDGQRHIGPTWSHLFGSDRTLTDGRHVVADEAYLTKSMMEPQADVVAGYTPVMPTYQGLLTAGETGALVALIVSLRDGPLAPEVTLPTLDVHARDAGADAASTP
ncbi:Cytochrome c oxidase polypeptide II [Labilithrix luteola]|uniref:cytochrome-c oxidase n=1 Tax=Labilithrix luteola TaxID=1391654 RepID=A0A0K1PVF3_9BACT|nr:cytochrome c oxidase subunit II [Labilithrix luteola]AKU97510.1 Cytochrome c oxidase polypeptide II [Labilithrix luteola]